MRAASVRVTAVCPAAGRYARHRATVRWRGRGAWLWRSPMAEHAAGSFSRTGTGGSSERGMS
jgi:hypothetical protein